MKSIKYIIGNLLSGLTLIFLSCDVLDQRPISQIASENFFQSATDAEAATVACYHGIMVPYANNVIIPNIVLADEGWAIRGGNWTRTQNFEVTATDGHVQDFWRDMYDALHRTNDVIEHTPTINDPSLQENRIMGEGYFLRGFILYHLTMRYGDVPMPLETSKSVDQILSMTRSTRTEILNQSINDLSLASELLPDNPQNKIRATKAAARAMLAKVLMMRNNSGDLDQALEQLDAILQTGGYQLLSSSNYHDMFENFRQESIESIWEISYGPTSEQAWGHGLDWEAMPVARPIANAMRLAPDPNLVEKFLENPNDIRIESNVRFFDNPSITNQTNYYIAKYQAAPLDEPRIRTPNIIVLRLADVILMRAEILNELGQQQEALEALNMIRERAQLVPSMATSQDELRLAIEDERYLELAFEGNRYYDLVRTGKAMEVINNYNGFNFDTNTESPRGVPLGQERLIWPIPARDLDLNPNLLPQNPGW